MSRVCKHCGTEQPLDNFALNRRSKGGILWKCKTCCNEYNKQRRANALLLEMDRERAKAKYKEDQQYAARRKANAKKQGSKPEAAARKKAKAKLDSLNQEKVNAARSWRKKWRLMNKHVVVANTALYRAQKLKATPRWASSKAILAMYKEANEKTMQTGVPHQVDHIVPLRSPKVCGLHCEANLQVIPALLNNAKNNLYWPDSP